MAYKTLGELRSLLQTRLGFDAAGAAAGVNAPIMDNFLYNAQVQLYWQFDWKKLTRWADIPVGTAQTLVDYPLAVNGAPADANPERILKLAVLVNGIWIELEEGITPAHYSYSDRRYYPQRYERYAQLELWPQADQAYTLRVWYVQQLGRFTEVDDRASLDDSLIFLHALVNAKQHYRQADGQIYANQLQALMSQMKSKGWGGRRFRRGGVPDATPRPVVV